MDIMRNENIYVFCILYHIGVRTTLKGENPYLHSVSSKNPETILRLYSSDTPGQTGIQFTAECTETLIFTSPSRRSRTQVWCTNVPHQGTLFPSCNLIPEGSSTNDYRTRGRSSNGFTEAVTHPTTNAGICCLTSVNNENWYCQRAT